MQGSVFLDTSVLLYLLSADVNKKTCVKSLLKSGCCISIQVLNEFANVSLKKFGQSADEVRETIGVLSQNSVVFGVNLSTIFYALSLKERYRYQFFDSLILATALENSCIVLLSEDMQDGHRLEEGLTIQNPFKQPLPIET